MIDVDRARVLTPGCSYVTHLNNAGAALPPTPVIEAVAGHLDAEWRIGSYEAAVAAEEAIQRPYRALAELIGCAADEIAFAPSATSAWDAAFFAIPFQAGDRIVTGRAEYSSNAMAMAQVVARVGVEVTLLPDDEHGQLDLAALDRALEDPKVRLVAATHVPTSSGLVNPVAEIGRRCRAAGVLFLLDACQSVGQLRIDVNEIGCDLLSATGRKYLRAPRGTGFLYARASVVDGLAPATVDLHSAAWTAPFGFELEAGAARFETFERNVAAHIGLGAAVDHLLEWGIDDVEERVVGLAERLRSQLAAVPGVVLRDPGARRCGIVTFTVEGHSPRAVVDRLRSGGVNTWVPPGDQSQLDLLPRGLGDGVVRASVHYYNTDDELARAVALVADVVREG